MFMTHFVTRLLLVFALAAFLVPVPVAQAQNPFEAVIEVNDDIITAYEIDQRQTFLRIISPANAGRETAVQELIDDRLRSQVLRQLGVELSDEEIREGMEEFAGRADLTAEQFLDVLAQRGVSEETFRDFVSVGIAWRELIRARYGNRVSISEAEVDRALAAASTGSGVRVLLSEIIMPAPPAEAAAVLARAERIAQADTFEEFSSFARQYSATESRDQGGRLGWTPITNLPAQLRPQILALAPGEVTQPISLPNAVALFQLRDIEEVDAPEPEYSAIEYAMYYIPGGRTEAALAQAARVRARVDQCDDLYGVARGQPENVLVRETKAPGEIRRDIALELAKLDPNETSTSLTTSDGTSLVVLMLCGRTPALEEEVGRDAIASRLRQDRLTGLAENYMQQLRADARIRER
jgi:peptidyl-prolyl cis-trans isomerase SurA